MADYMDMMKDLSAKDKQRESKLAKEVSDLMNTKYGRSDSLIVELTQSK